MNLGQIINAIAWRKYRGEPDSAQREDLVRLINQAAREVWVMSDWPKTLREQTFPVALETVVALPSYVAEVRAIRDDYGPVELHTRAPRFNASFWKPETCRTYRELGRSPTMKSRLNATTVLVEDNDDDCEITFVGQTPLSNRRNIKFIGNGEVPGSNFTAIETIRKSKQTEFNVKVYETGGCLLSEIPNNQLEVNYLIIELQEYMMDKCKAKGFPRCVEVLYKPTLSDLVEDNDEFPAPNMGDAVVSKYWEIEAVYGNNLEAAALHERKGNKLIRETTRNQEIGKTFELKLPKRRTFGQSMERYYGDSHIR